ncbi:twinfilin-2-A-like isoform X1 [Gordionus sp. m RMFG-2023]|uniref:twinfilin-2-A-like isoform X1 n=1 Tax=Gordionus sp. m RMFG-2023 TaxID=3053472 RepID=UPI0031FBB2F4
MSHQTGIKCSSDLLKFLATSKTSSKIRAVKISIDSEKLILDKVENAKQSWMQDYDRIISKFIEDKQPCYIFYRLDNIGDSSYNWLFITWSPDDAPIKQKMIYASTKATLKKEFGLSLISNELFSTSKLEVLLKQAKATVLENMDMILKCDPQTNHTKIHHCPNNSIYIPKHMNSQNHLNHSNGKTNYNGSGDITLISNDAHKRLSTLNFSNHTLHPNNTKISAQYSPPISTNTTYWPQKLNGEQNQVLPGIDTKQKSMHGISFPFTNDLKISLNEFKSGAMNYIRMKIDIDREEVAFDHASKNADVHSLPKLIPISSPKYHLFRYKHVFENQNLQDIIFIYSMPGQSSCSIKEKMLYSSCKHKVIENLKYITGLEISKTFEIEAGNELTSEYIDSELHPKAVETKEKFSKPKGPSSRGPRRIIKNI